MKLVSIKLWVLSQWKSRMSRMVKRVIKSIQILWHKNIQRAYFRDENLRERNNAYSKPKLDFRVYFIKEILKYFWILHIWEVVPWIIAHLRSCPLGNCTFGKFPLATWEIVTWKPKNQFCQLLLCQLAQICTLDS